MHLSDLLAFPVKSCGPMPTDAADVQARGIAGDRRWMVVDPDGRFITARTEPRLLLVTPALTDRGLSLAAPGMPVLAVAAPTGDSKAVRVWRDDVQAFEASETANRWFSKFLGRSCTLVYQGGNRREISSRTGARAGDEVSFADGYPLLLIGSASLEDLNRRLARPVSMLRFRPNLVVATDRPYAEDEWASVQIGSCEFSVARPCTRCVLTTVDPATGIADPDREPLATLRSYRRSRSAGGVLFGVNLIPRRLGRVAVGMAVEANTGG